MDEHEGPIVSLVLLPLVGAGVGVGLYFAGLYRYPPTDETGLFAIGVGVGIGFYVLYMVMAFALMRRDSAKVARLGIIAAIAAIGVPIFGTGTAMYVNGALDFSRPEEREVSIMGVGGKVSTGVGRRRGGGVYKPNVSWGEEASAYWIRVPSWRPGVREEVFQVSISEGERAAAKELKGYHLTVQRGLFRVPWLAKAKAIDAYPPGTRPRRN